MSQSFSTGLSRRLAPAKRGQEDTANQRGRAWVFLDGLRRSLAGPARIPTPRSYRDLQGPAIGLGARERTRHRHHAARMAADAGHHVPHRYRGAHRGIESPPAERGKVDLGPRVRRGVPGLRRRCSAGSRSRIAPPLRGAWPRPSSASPCRGTTRSRAPACVPGSARPFDATLIPHGAEHQLRTARASSPRHRPDPASATAPATPAPVTRLRGKRATDRRR